MSLSLSAQIQLSQNSEFILKVQAAVVNAAIAIANEVANAAFSLASTATGGTFTLSFGGQVTPALAFNATAAQIQAALAALSSIGTGNVICTGGPLGTAIVITFTGTLGNQALNAPTIASSLTGGTATITPSQTGVSVVNHAARAALANAILLNPSGYASLFAWGVAGNATVQSDWCTLNPVVVNQPGATGSATDLTDDTNVNNAVTSIFNAY